MEEIIKPATESIETKKEIVEDVSIGNSEFIAIDEARKKINELELMNRRLEENIKRGDRLIAENMVRGKSFAGQREMTEEEKSIEECKKMLEGTGLDPFK